MAKEFEEFKEKFRVDELIISENKSWVWSVRPLQPTLGAGVLSLKRFAQAFSEITEEEGKDLSEIVKLIEQQLQTVFAYEKINYLMLMMVDNHLHFHIIPRYSEKKEFDGYDWEDEGWPGPPSLKGGEVKDSTLFKIKEKLNPQ